MIFSPDMRCNRGVPNISVADNTMHFTAPDPDEATHGESQRTDVKGRARSGLIRLEPLGLPSEFEET